MEASRYTPGEDAWDLVFADDADDTNPLTLMLVQDDEAAMWEGVDAPSLTTDQAVYREQAVMWQPLLGTGYSRRTPETTTVGVDGQIVSTATAYGRNASFVVPGIAMPAGKLTPVVLDGSKITSGRIIDAAEYGASQDLYFTTGIRYLIRIPSGTNTGAIIYDDRGVGLQTTNLEVFNGNLYLTNGSSGVMHEWNGTTWTAAAADCKAWSLGIVNWVPSNAIMDGSGGGSPADHLILTSQFRTGFYHVVDGTDVKNFANWIGKAGSPIPVGQEHHLINALVTSPRTVWFAKPEGLIGVTETGRAVNLTPWIGRTTDFNNGVVSTFFSDDERAFVFYAHAYGLVAIAVNGTLQETARFVQFGSKGPNETPIWGRPRAICPGVDGVFVAYYDGTNSYVGRLILERDGGLRWSMSECTIANEEVTFLRFCSPGGAPRLWIATRDSGGIPKLYWQDQPRSGNPWVDYQAATAYRSAIEWDAYIPRDDAGSSAEKVVRRYDLVTRGVGDGNQVTVAASVDDAAYLDEGTVTSGTRTSFIASQYQSGVEWNWRLRGQNSESAPVAIETFQARMSVLPEQTDVWTFRCQLAKGQGLENGASDQQDPYAVRSRIRAYQRRGPIHMRRSPLSRETAVVKIEQGSRIQVVWSRKDRAYIVVLTLTVSILQQGAVYGADVYDAASSEYGATSGA